MPIPQNTFPMDGSQRAPLRATQGIWACIFFRRRRHFCTPDFAPPPPERVPGPFCTPPALQKRPPCHIQAWQSSLMAHNGRSRGQDFTLLPENVGRFPSKTPPDSDLALCLSMNMYVYARICTYVHRCTYKSQKRIYTAKIYHNICANMA